MNPNNIYIICIKDLISIKWRQVSSCYFGSWIVPNPSTYVYISNIYIYIYIYIYQSNRRFNYKKLKR